jgi:hypothetical protein
MKVETILFCNSLPEIQMEGLNYKIDFGTVVLILTPVEAASLCVNILTHGEVKASVFEILNKRLIILLKGC